MTETLELPLSPQYCRDWTANEALREILANAIDSKASIIQAWWDNGVGHVYNSQGELDRSNLVLGGTSKADNDDTIGTFGEGLKVGAMVLLREGHWVRVETGPLALEFAMGFSNAFNSEVVKVHIDQQPAHDGTVVKVGIDEQTFNEAKDLFLQFKSHKLEVIIDGNAGAMARPGSEGGFLYSHGVQVYDGDGDRGKLLFTWNLDELEINRDRTMVDSYDVRSHMESILENCDDPVAIEIFLKKWLNNGQGTFEEELNLRPYSKTAWNEALEALYGELDAIAIHTNDIATDIAQGAGYRVLKLTSEGDSLLRHLGITNDWEAASGKQDFVIVDDLTREETRVLNQARKICEAVIGVNGDYNLVAFERTAREITQTPEQLLDGYSKGERGFTLGKWDSEKNTVYIRRILISTSKWKQLLHTLMHELVHRKKGHYDGSREFADDLLDPLVEILSVVSLKGLLY